MVWGNVMDRVCDRVCGGVCDRVCDGCRLSQRVSQAEGVTEVWLFEKDSFKECPLTSTPLQGSDVLALLVLESERESC